MGSNMRDIGARYHGNGMCEFTVWAPNARRVSLHVMAPDDRLVPMTEREHGYWSSTADGVFPGARYLYRLSDSLERADPASFFQPEGVHGPSEVLDHESFDWHDAGWSGVPLDRMIIYEVHVGTFTRAGTFRGVIDRLDDLAELGITALELMPVAQFPGERNWGYDGVLPFSVQNSYGGPEGLRLLVDACHGNGIAVILDVVYNHLGPEGNHLSDFGPYFTDRYRTPWGKAVNFDGPRSSEVRNYFIRNAISWFENYHVDALRLDAVHGIFDQSAKHILRELAECVEECCRTAGRKLLLIAESDLNDARIIEDRQRGGYGVDAQWNDDFHHSLHTLLTGERSGYYEDFGSIEDLAKAIREGFIYDWRYSRYRKRYHGSPSGHLPADRFIVSAQNHDQVGNRMRGERLSGLVSFEALKLAAGVTLVTPAVPLLFMGEEYAEERPFLYFVSHTDPDLVRTVREGRKEEFSSFGWDGEPADPQAEDTFLSSKLSWDHRNSGLHGVMLEYYRRLLELRRTIPTLSTPAREGLEVGCDEEGRLLRLERRRGDSSVLCVMNFSGEKLRYTTAVRRTVTGKLLDSADEKWMGPGPTAPERPEPGEGFSLQPHNLVIYDIQGGSWTGT
jgi:maltooligosyltrehalose trehalohydrolase